MMNDDVSKLITPNLLIRLATVGVIVAAVGAAFVYTGGWLTPHKVTPAKFIDTFEQINGQHPGFRRNHAKGVGISGTFESNGYAERLSKAVVFKTGRVPIVGRFALAGGMPYAGDTAQNVRSMALQFLLPNGEEWRTGMNNIPVFIVNNPIAFRDQMLATAPDPATGKPDPAKAKAFFETHPESAKALGLIKGQKPSSGFDNSTFNSLDAFEFTNADGKVTPVRWAMVPVQPFAAPASQPASSQPSMSDANYLFDDLIAAVEKKPLQWHLIVTVGQPGDSTSDATIPWPPDRETVDAGTLTIDHVEAEATSPARTINYDPLVLPNGIAGSDDPLLSARSAAYAQSFTRRVGEPVSASAVTPAAIDQAANQPGNQGGSDAKSK